MRAVIQRVSAADVVVNGGAPRAIGRGLMILLGRVETGEFGADMKVTLTNDGPVTIVIDTDEWKR